MGILISKFPNLLSGYNTLSDEEKESLKNTEYTLYLRNVFIICGLASIFLTFLLLNIFKRTLNAWSPVILIIPIPPSPGAVDIAAIVSIITSLL